MRKKLFEITLIKKFPTTNHRMVLRIGNGSKGSRWNLPSVTYYKAEESMSTGLTLLLST